MPMAVESPATNPPSLPFTSERRLLPSADAMIGLLQPWATHSIRPKRVETVRFLIASCLIVLLLGSHASASGAQRAKGGSLRNLLEASIALPSQKPDPFYPADLELRLRNVSGRTVTVYQTDVWTTNIVEVVDLDGESPMLTQAGIRARQRFADSATRDGNIKLSLEPGKTFIDPLPTRWHDLYELTNGVSYRMRVHHKEIFDDQVDLYTQWITFRWENGQMNLLNLGFEPRS